MSISVKSSDLLWIQILLDAMKMKVSPVTIKALKLVCDHGPVAPAKFAELMWPDSPAWNRVYTVGNKGGAVRGRGILRSAGSYLGKLRKAGLVYRNSNWLYEISADGIEAIESQVRNG